METNEHMRKRVLRLVNKHGLNQKMLAARLGMTPSTFSKWLNRKAGINAPSVDVFDRFNTYAKELSADALGEETHRATAVPPTGGGSFQDAEKTARPPDSGGRK